MSNNGKYFVIYKNRDFLYKLSLRLLDYIKKEKILLKKIFDIIETDGSIIGTGQSDYTKGSTEYSITINNKEFILMDMPGIEGHEKNFKDEIMKSVKKSHMIFYVCNKQPDEATISKLREYLNSTSYLATINNIKSYSSQYNDIDIKDLTLNKTNKDKIDIGKKIEERVEQLFKEDCYKKDAYVGNLNVHGLAGFLSASQIKGITTIINDSKKGLNKNQEKFLNVFEDYDTMRKFSNIDDISDFISKKSVSYEKDIEEANKNNILKEIDDLINKLEPMLESHSKLISNFDKEVEYALKDIDETFDFFYSKFKENCELRLGRIFNELNCEFFNVIDEIIESNFFDKFKVFFSKKKTVDNYNMRLRENINHKLNILEKDIEEIFKNDSEEFSKQLKNKLDKVHYNLSMIKKLYDFKLKDNYIRAFDTQTILENIFPSFSKLLKNIGKNLLSNIFNIAFLFRSVFNIISLSISTLFTIIKTIFDKEVADDAKKKIKSNIEEIKNKTIYQFNLELSKNKPEMTKEIDKIKKFLKKENENNKKIYETILLKINNIKRVKKNLV